ncbi:hypothetical protein [Haloarcula sp. CGMCC 1.6347]|uniref:hypothetical protein n=1 Tax=Haloarcula sp. CGMCC 1.6347 TaxID=3111455 RepID=UPI00300EB4FD
MSTSNDGYYGAAELSERFDQLLDIDVPRDVVQVEDKRALDVLLMILQNYDPNYHPDLTNDPMQAPAVQRLLQRALSRGAWDAIYTAHGARLDAYTGLTSNYADMSPDEVLGEIESLWKDYPTFATYVFAKGPPAGPTGMGKTNFSYKLLNIGQRVYPQMKVASNNDSDPYKTIQSWTDLVEWLKTTDGRKSFLFDEAAQELMYADMTAGKVVSKLLKLLRHHRGNIIFVGHTGRDIPKDVRRQLLIVKKLSQDTAEFGVGLEETGEGIAISSSILKVKGIRETRTDYDDIDDEGHFDFDGLDGDGSSDESDIEDAPRCQATTKDDELCPNDAKIPGKNPVVCKSHRNKRDEFTSDDSSNSCKVCSNSVGIKNGFCVNHDETDLE